MNFIDVIENKSITDTERGKAINQHLEKIADMENSIIIYTDLKKIIYVTRNSLIYKNIKISDKYITLIKSMFYKNDVIKIKNGNIISINDDLRLDIIKGQIIIPLIISNELIGSVVCFNKIEEFENYEFQFAATAIKHIKKIIEYKNIQHKTANDKN